MTKCLCGCGKDISCKKVWRGAKFVNRAHFVKWRAEQIKLGLYQTAKRSKKYEFSESENDIDYGKGIEYCNSYNNDDIKCVVCYEQNLIKNKSCANKGGCK